MFIYVCVNVYTYYIYNDQSGAKLILIDFGLVARIERKDQDLMVGIYIV